MIRDLGPYSTRNTSKGALLEETAQLLKALSSGFSISEVRTQALDGSVFYQRARASRLRIWRIIHYRFLAQGAKWITDDLKKSCEKGRHNPDFISLVYLHYVLRDHLTFDFVTKIVWRYWCERHQFVYRDDVLWLLDKAADTQKQISRWSESSRRKVAGSILTALRDNRGGRSPGLGVLVFGRKEGDRGMGRWRRAHGSGLRNPHWEGAPGTRAGVRLASCKSLKGKGDHLVAPGGVLVANNMKVISVRLDAAGQWRMIVKT